jgi:hypothetical protein
MDVGNMWLLGTTEVTKYAKIEPFKLWYSHKKPAREAAGTARGTKKHEDIYCRNYANCLIRVLCAFL